MIVSALQTAANEARALNCQSNIRQIIQSMLFYVGAQGGPLLIPWYQYPPHAGYAPSLFTPYVFGGFQTPIPEDDGLTADYEVYPAQIRSLNPYVDKRAQGGSVIDVFMDETAGRARQRSSDRAVSGSKKPRLLLGNDSVAAIR